MTDCIVLVISVGYVQRYQQVLLYHRIKAMQKGDQERFLSPHASKDFTAICQLNTEVELSVNHYIDGFGSMSNLI